MERSDNEEAGQWNSQIIKQGSGTANNEEAGKWNSQIMWKRDNGTVR